MKCQMRPFGFPSSYFFVHETFYANLQLAMLIVAVACMVDMVVDEITFYMQSLLTLFLFHFWSFLS